MILNARAPELWTDPRLISGLGSLARHLGWDEGDLLGETAVRLLQRQQTFVIDSPDPVGYVLGVARRIALSLDPASLLRKRQKRCEDKFKRWRATIEDGADRRRNGECLFSPGHRTSGREDEPVQFAQVTELRSSIESAVSPEQQAVLHAWEQGSPGQNPTTRVAQALGVSLPTARKRIAKERRRLRLVLADYASE